MDNYQKLLERLSRLTGLSQEEIERKVEAKRAKLSGLISKEGAAQIVAAELGISFETEQLKIAELVHGMRRVNVVGKITKVFPVREFKKQEREGKIGSFLLGDANANVRAVCWDANHIKLLETGELKEGDVIAVSNAAVKNGELHLSGFADIKKSNEVFDYVVTEQQFALGKLYEAGPGKIMKVHAVIVQIFGPRYFDAQETNQKRAVLNIVLDDGTETMRAVLFGQHIQKLGFVEEEIFSLDKFEKKKSELLGEERYFTGTFRTNTYFNRLEMAIDTVDTIDVDLLAKELEAKAYV